VLPPSRFTILPNTAGCYDVKTAVRTCKLARELLDGHNLVKLEVLGDERTSSRTSSRPCRPRRSWWPTASRSWSTRTTTHHREAAGDLGCIAVMPLAAPIGSGLGIRNRFNIMTIVENAKVPILVDAGVGTASDAAIAMELGCDGVLMNTAIAAAKNPVLMASAMKKAIEAAARPISPAACRPSASPRPRRRWTERSSEVGAGPVGAASGRDL